MTREERRMLGNFIIESNKLYDLLNADLRSNGCCYSEEKRSQILKPFYDLTLKIIDQCNLKADCNRLVFDNFRKLSTLLEIFINLFILDNDDSRGYWFLLINRIADLIYFSYLLVYCNYRFEKGIEA